MKSNQKLGPLFVVCALTAGCGGSASDAELLFIHGRAVASAGDSLFAMTAGNVHGVLLRNVPARTIDTLGLDDLESPGHVQWINERWFVSDVREGRRSVAVFTADRMLERRVAVDTVATAAHQFAVLPDGRIVVESGDGRLVVLGDDSATTFALVETGTRTGMIVAARGGVLYAAPDRSVTLYNALGRIRWRIDWPWDDSTFVADIAVDSQGRPHVLAGREGVDGFVVFGISPITGEVVRWSEPGPYATFVVRRLGQILPDSASRWLGTR